MSEIKRNSFTGQQKAKVALEAVRGLKTINEIAQEHSVHPTQVRQWKKELVEQAAAFFDGKRGRSQLTRKAIRTGCTRRLVN
jgi:transposase-like protein